jgi:hypothetical protein
MNLDILRHIEWLIYSIIVYGYLVIVMLPVEIEDNIMR